MTPRATLDRIAIRSATIATVIMSALISAATVPAQTTPFYKDKTIRIIVGFTLHCDYCNDNRIFVINLCHHRIGPDDAILQR